MKNKNGIKNKEKTSKFNHKQNKISNKKTIFLLSIIIIILLALTFIFNHNRIIKQKNDIAKADELIKSENAQIGENAIISSAQERKIITGTAPFDENDAPGNDSSESNNIVRSFDEITWTLDLTLSLKTGSTETNLTGGKINIKVDLPESTANVVEWNLDSMTWLENGNISEDGKTLTGSYTLPDTEITIPGQQTLEFVLKTKGIGNGTEIIPYFEFNLEGNSENEKYTYTRRTIITSAVGNYNISLKYNMSCDKRVSVNLNGDSSYGKMYGYGFIIQLYNNNKEKGLKGIEYPKDEISFDLDLKLERSKENSSELEDITDKCTPILWNYKINISGANNGTIPNRTMQWGTANENHNRHIPYGISTENLSNSVYNSGKISMNQENEKIHVVIKDYKFDATFPKYNFEYTENNIIYTDNIGCFSTGYLQIFVPDNDYTKLDNRKYYLTITDSNENFTTNSNSKVQNQVIKTDDSIRLEYIRLPKVEYGDFIDLAGSNILGLTNRGRNGDTRICIGNTFEAFITTSISNSATEEQYVYSSNQLFKFDGNGLEVVSYKNNTGLNINAYYLTKKDGSNWTSQQEMNNTSNFESFNFYENINDIPDNHICIGMFFESTTSGYMSPEWKSIQVTMKVKNEANINQTYGMTLNSNFWDKEHELDRNIYTIKNKDLKFSDYPTPTWSSGNPQYIKTEYDENGNKIPGTHSGSYDWGNTICAISTNLYGNISTIDENNTPKLNYDLTKNENVITYKVEPKLDKNANLTSQISGVTLKADVTLPKGLSYIGQSSNYENPNITNNSDGSSTLTWYLENCTSGTTITPITFDAQIDNETPNATSYTSTFIISEVINSNGIVKIGTSDIKTRTSSTTVNISNLASHRIYKEADLTTLENDTELKYTIVYENKTEDTLPDFQVLDIMPYNGDSRGSRFSGDYTISQINVTQTINNQVQSNSNLNLYTTNSEEVRNIDAKNTEIGTSSIWQTKQIGTTLNEKMTGIAVKGNIPRKNKIRNRNNNKNKWK